MIKKITAKPIGVKNWDRKRWPNFKASEFKCAHSGKVEMHEEFLDYLKALRTNCGFAFNINSAFRDKTHPIEAQKGADAISTHASGLACDIGVAYGQAYELVNQALKMGCFSGIGVNQKRRKSRAVYSYRRTAFVGTTETDLELLRLEKAGGFS